MAKTPPGPVGGGRPNPQNPPTRHPGAQGGPKKCGGAKKNGGGKKKAHGGPLYKRAARDIRLANQPYLDAIHQAQIQARQQYAQDAARVKSIYDAFAGQIGGIGDAYRSATAGIPGDLQSQIQALTGMVGSSVPGVPAAENAAGAGVLGAIGGGTLEQLATDASRNAAYNASAARQGGIEGLTASRNYLQDFQNLRDQMAARKLDTKSTMASQIMQRLNDLRDQQFQQQLAMKQFGLSAADQARLNRATNASIAAQPAATAQANGDRAAAIAAHNAYNRRHGAGGATRHPFRGGGGGSRPTYSGHPVT